MFIHLFSHLFNKFCCFLSLFCTFFYPKRLRLLSVVLITTMFIDISDKIKSSLLSKLEFASVCNTLQEPCFIKHALH